LPVARNRREAQGRAGSRRRIAATACARRSDAVAVQFDGDAAGALAMGILAEDAPDDRRFGGVDAAFAGGEAAVGQGPALEPIAVAEPARRFAGPDPSLHPAMGLLGEMAKEEGIHRPAEADVQLVDLALGL